MFNLNKLSAILTVTLCAIGMPVIAASSDSDISAMVNSKITADKTTKNSKIDVDTKNGVVFLTGNVETEGEASAAIEAANSVAAVKDVESDGLTVKNSIHPYKDAYITAKVKGAFIREKLFGDKAVDVMGINVETKDGVVHLTGTAENQAQINTAVSLAKGIKGVKEVQSKVVIKTT